MKRFLLFGFDEYYPSGGLHDLIDSTDSLEFCELTVQGQEYKCEYYQVLDIETGERYYFDDEKFVKIDE